MRSLTCSLGWVQRALTLLLLLILTATSTGLLGLTSARSAAAAPRLRTSRRSAPSTWSSSSTSPVRWPATSAARPDGSGQTRHERRDRRAPRAEGVNVGFRIYGHLGDNTEAGRDVSCPVLGPCRPLQGVNKPALRDQVAAAQPIGWTPIALSLQRAGGDFQAGEGVANHILLVTDGEETCGGDPCLVAESLRTGEANLTTHVVGFALNEEQARLVSCIAERGGGLNLRAASARELSNALFSVLEEIQVVVQNGFLEIEEIGGLFPRATITFVATGDQDPRDAITLTTDNRVELAVGFYDVSWTYATGARSRSGSISRPGAPPGYGLLAQFPQGAGEIYVVRDLAGTVIWQAPFEQGDYAGSSPVSTPWNLSSASAIRC